MKKALLLAASTLLTASSALAGVVYVPTGETVTEVTDGLYVLHASMAKTPATRNGLLIANGDPINDGNSFAKYNDPDYRAIPTSPVDDQNLIWEVKKNDDGTFSLKSIGQDQYFAAMTVKHAGAQGGGQNAWVGSIQKTDGSEGSYDIAEFSAIEVIDPTISKTESEGNLYIDDGHKRFFLRCMNIKGQHSTATTAEYPYMYANDGNGAQSVTFWAYAQATSLQFEFIPVTEEQTIDITVTFPKWNGVDIEETLVGYANADAGSLISAYVDGYGGIKNMKINSVDSDNLIVSSDNKKFVVEGDWNYDFAPNQVYRVCVNPDDKAAALRYMLLTGELRTHADSDESEMTESLKRLVPERLWFFKPVDGEENVYTIHNLYNQGLGIHFDNNNDGTKASLTNNPTHFEMVDKINVTNQFYLKVAGSETAYVCDDGSGLFSIKNQTVAEGNYPEKGSLIQLYPLTNDDYATLNVDPSINYAYADNETFTQAISDWNAQNIAAAIRRIEFWGGESLIGNKPGQFNNEDDTFLKKLEYAKQLLADGEADPKILNPAVDDISYEKLTKFTPITTGYFFRLKNRTSGRYLSNLTGMTQNNQSYIDMVAADDALYSNTVWYYMKDGEDTMLVSFDSGCVLSTMDNWASWRPVVSTATCIENPGTENAIERDAAAKSVEISQQAGRWHVIHLREYQKGDKTSPTHRHLHGANKYAAAGEHESLTSLIFTNSDYQWQLELVEELPVPIYNDEDTEAAWASIYSPVPLQIQNGEAVAYTGKFATDKVVKTEIGNIIPANTPVLLDYKKGAEIPERPDGVTFRDGVMYIYLKVLYDGAPSEAMLFDGEEETAPTPEVEGQDLNGGILAISKEDGTKYFSLHTTNTNNFREYEGIKLGPSKTAAYIPGFKAHLALTPEQVDNLTSDENGTIIPIKAANDNTDGISEVTSESVKAVYDLQGRKLAAPAKGINIINGQKVLVK